MNSESCSEHNGGVIVVVDSTAFANDSNLAGPGMRVFLESLPHSNHEFILPEVVKDEMFGRIYKDGLAEHEKHEKPSKNGKQKLHRDIAGLFYHPLPSKEEIRETAKRAHRSVIERLKLSGVQEWPYPNIAHTTVIERKSLARKPFSTRGDKGYADYLIWETVVQIAKTHDRDVVFVSSDNSAFGTEEGFDTDLVDDLKERGIEPGRITGKRTLQDFNDFYLKGVLLEDARRELAERGCYGSLDMAAILQAHIGNELVGMRLNEPVQGTLFPGDIGGSDFIEAVDSTKLVEVRQVARTLSDELLVTADVTVIATAQRGNWQATMSADDRSSPKLHGFEDDDKYPVRFDTVVQFTFDDGQGEVTSFDIRRITGRSD